MAFANLSVIVRWRRTAGKMTPCRHVETFCGRAGHNFVTKGVFAAWMKTLSLATAIGGLAALLLALAPGAADAASPPSFPPLHVDCRGEGTASPTVILEAGAFGTSADWDFVLDDLAAEGRVCAYDRAGLGQSPARPGEPYSQVGIRFQSMTPDRQAELDRYLEDLVRRS